MMNTVSSDYHIKMNPSDAGHYDRYLVQVLLREMTRVTPLAPSDGVRCNGIVFLTDADVLSKVAQQSMRSTMEKLYRSFRLILCCTSVSKIIDPILSRCSCIRVPSPQTNGILRVLRSVCRREKIKIPGLFMSKILSASNGNIRKALLM